MAAPVIVPSVPNLPFNTNVPASRPTLPSGNSTVPENITEPSSPWVHFASEGLAGPQTFNPGSRSRKEPFPDSRASRQRTAIAIPERDFHSPTADDVRRLRLGQANAEYLGEYDQNQCRFWYHNYPLLAICYLPICVALRLRSIRNLKRVRQKPG